MILIFIIWLVPRAGKMTQIARCDWLPERARWSHLARSGLPAVSRKQNCPQKPYNKSFIDQVCSVKMAGYWPRSFFASLWTSTSSRSINTPKKNLANIQPSWPHTWSITHTYCTCSCLYDVLFSQQCDLELFKLGPHQQTFIIPRIHIHRALVLLRMEQLPSMIALEITTPIHYGGELQFWWIMTGQLLSLEKYHSVWNLNN